MPVKKKLEEMTPTSRKQYKIQELWGKHKEILRLRALGFKLYEISQITGYSIQNISKLCRTELGKQHIDMLDAMADTEAIDIMAGIKALAPIAVAIKEEILLDDQDKVSLMDKDKVASDILDRAGHSKIQRSVNANLNVGMTAEDMAEIKKRAQELKEELDIQEAS